VSGSDWFADWVQSNLGVTLTAVRGPAGGGLVAAFGLSSFDRGELTLAEADELAAPVVRIGATDGWVFAVEHFTVTSTDPAFLERLTSAGGEAVVLCFTQTASACLYARDGEYVAGFDVVVPHVRWGRDQHAFDREMADAGLLADDGPRPAAACADFVARTFGLTVTRGMLEDRLPCGTLPG
jgi:hypothetical protein